MRPGPSPAAAAAMAASPALVGSWAAPCRAAERPDAVTITCPVPSVDAREEGACVSVFVSWAPPTSVAACTVGEGLKEEGVIAEVAMGAVEITDAVFVVAAPGVVPGAAGKCWRVTSGHRHTQGPRADVLC